MSEKLHRPGIGADVGSRKYFERMIADIALLTDRRYTATHAEPGDWYLANILQDDQLLSDALKLHGLSTRRVDWADPSLDLREYRAAVFRTTWDYFERAAEFQAWLKRCATDTRWINPLATVQWNLDKRYLADLDAKGVAIVPSLFLDDATTLHVALARSGWTNAVVKPCVSGGAWLTYRVNPDNVAEVEELIRPHRPALAFLLQPFQEQIQQQGEITLMTMGGRVTHAIRKTAKPGDYRVQDDHGGTVHRHTPTPEELSFAEGAIAAVTPTPVYGRVDIVRGNDGTLMVMELELVEPELWLRFHPPSATVMAAAIHQQLSG
jgi:glutathione synthase/RimK-type ligase-like ATP-grasp enzyme